MNERPFSILILSPDRLTLRRGAKFLEVFGHEVRTATNAAQALSAAEAKRPDFLIVDGGGPPADLQICDAIRRSWNEDYVYALLLAEHPQVGDVTAALEQGFDDVLAAPIVFGELLARLRAGARVIEFERRFAHQTGVDAATGLADKTAIAAELARRAHGTKGAIGWLAILELDFFERFANRLGRAGATTLLAQVAQHVATYSGRDCFCAGLGEERLAVLMPAQGRESATAWCETALKSLAETIFSVNELPQQVTASCGLTEVSAGENLEVVAVRAAKALALAKNSGRNCAVTSGEVERDADDWAAFAANGKLFQTTTARDVMHPCPLVIHCDETLDQAQSALSLTGLSHAAVVDADGKLAGIVSLDQLAALRLRQPRPSGPAGNHSSSVRLVRHVLQTDVTRFDEGTPLTQLMEYFAGEDATVAVIVRDNRPRGLIHCQALATLNERLTANRFIQTRLASGGSADLGVPELALAE